MQIDTSESWRLLSEQKFSVIKISPLHSTKYSLVVVKMGTSRTLLISLLLFSNSFLYNIIFIEKKYRTIKHGLFLDLRLKILGSFSNKITYNTNQLFKI